MSHMEYENIGDPKDRLVEEIGELLQAIGKGERFGWDNHHPDRTISNLEQLGTEWVDIIAAYNKFVNSINI